MAEQNITTKFQVDISQLKAGIQEANRNNKLANSEFKAVASSMDNWRDSIEGVTAKTKQLNKIKEEEEKNDVSKYKAGKLVIDLESKQNDEFINSFATCANRKIFVGE
jgi:hypothetical protein